MIESFLEINGKEIDCDKVKKFFTETIEGDLQKYKIKYGFKGDEQMYLEIGIYDENDNDIPKKYFELKENSTEIDIYGFQCNSAFFMLFENVKEKYSKITIEIKLIY